jgi:hypothetical protein
VAWFPPLKITPYSKSKKERISKLGTRDMEIATAFSSTAVNSGHRNWTVPSALALLRDAAHSSA